MRTEVSYFILGGVLSFIWILHFFGTRITSKTKPKIKINIKPFIKDSCVILFNKHIHHWIIFLCLFVTSSILLYFYKYKLLNVIHGFSFIQIVHGLSYKDRFDFSIKE